MQYQVSYHIFNTQEGSKESGTIRQTTNKLHKAKLIAERNLGRIEWQGSDPFSGCIGEAQKGFELTLVSICPIN